MLNRLPKPLSFLVIIALVFILYVSCRLPSSTKTPAPVTLLNSAPVAGTILGAREWKPSSEGNLTCTATDPDEDNLNYIWSAENGTIKGEGNQVVWVAPDSTGDYTVSVHVTDGKGGEATASNRFKVVTNPYGNDSPDMTIYLNVTVPSGSVIQEFRRVRTWTTSEIQCNVQNIDAGEVTYRWSSPVGKLSGNGISDGKASRVGWVAPGVASKYTVDVTVTDKEGNESKGKVTFEVLCCRD